MTTSSNTFSRLLALLPVCTFMFLWSGCKQTPPEDPKQATSNKVAAQQADPYSITRQLFDEKTLEGWEITDFGTEEKVTVEDNAIVMEAGYPIAGINRLAEEDLPTNNYEISLEAKRIEGIDFFCGLTFPVHDSHCTLVVAGWAGATVGLSCIDNLDASSNDTNLLMSFKDNQWYAIKVRVTDDEIQCWIDDERVVQQKLAGHKISLRNDVLDCRPLGLCAFESKVAYRNIVLKHEPPSADEN